VVLLLCAGCCADRACFYIAPEEAVALHGIARPHGPRTSPQFNLAALVAAEAVPAADEADDQPHILLSEHDALCAAADGSTLAAVIEVERRLALARAADAQTDTERCSSILQSDLLSLRIIEKRNEAAAGALRALLKLAEVEAGIDSLHAGLEENRHVARLAEKLKAAGQVFPGDATEIERKRLDLKAQLADLNGAKGKLNAELRKLILLKDHSGRSISPQIDPRVSTAMPDAAAEVKVALSQRPDIAALELLLAATSQETLPAVRAALSAVDGALGSSPGIWETLRSLLCHDDCPTELEARCAQLERLLLDRRRQVTEEVRAAVAEIRAAAGRLTLARQKVASWKRRIGQLKRLQQADKATAFDRARARASLIEAEAEVTRRVIALKLGRLKLREVQGVLSQECGHAGMPAPVAAPPVADRRGDETSVLTHPVNLRR